MRRTFLVAVPSGVFFAVLMHCIAGRLWSDLGDWPALIGCAAGALVGAVAGAAESLVRAIDAQTARLAALIENRQHAARPLAVREPSTEIQAATHGHDLA
jgi:hypothetical protein